MSTFKKHPHEIALVMFSTLGFSFCLITIIFFKKTLSDNLTFSATIIGLVSLLIFLILDAKNERNRNLFWKKQLKIIAVSTLTSFIVFIWAHAHICPNKKSRASIQVTGFFVVFSII